MKRSSRKLLILLLTFAMVLGLVPALGLTTLAYSGIVTTEEDLRSALSAEGEAMVTLGADITTSAELTVVGVKTLDLNGYGIKANTTDIKKFSVINVSSKAMLNLTDSGSTTHYYYLDDNSLAHVVESAQDENYTGADPDKKGSFTGGYITGGSGSKFSANNAVFYLGGGVQTYGTFNMSGGAILGNTADNGGGVCNLMSGKFTMTGGTILGNTVFDSFGGGGVFLFDVGGLGCRFIMNGGTISYNAALCGPTNPNGAVYGGGVYNFGGMIEMSGGMISHNRASQGGGGVENYNNGKFIMTDKAVISHNTAVYGSGVENTYSSTFTMSGGTISYNTTIVKNDDAAGGGVINTYNSTVTISGGAIEHNQSPYGAGVENGTGTDGDNSTVTMSGGMISYNEAGSFIHSEGYEKGGAAGGLENRGGTFKIDGGTISHNEARAGGGVVSYSNAKFIMTGGTISYNTASLRSGGVENGMDGDNSTFTMTGGTISCNTAPSIGGVYNHESRFRMLGGTISQNEAVYNGGGVFVQGGTFSMSEEAAISGNTATTNNGGGVYVAIGTFTMNGAEITGNTAGQSGGGVYVASGCTFTMNGGAVTGNTAATLNGGGVCVQGGTFSMSEEAAISGNIAKSGGGVSVAANGTFTMNGAEITDNTASLNGGGVNLLYGTFTVNDGAISGNTAAQYGGGVYALPNGAINVSGNPVIAGNVVGGTANNAHLMSPGDSDKTINIINKLERGASIGVTTGSLLQREKPLTFAQADGSYNNGALANDDIACFFSDSAAYGVVPSEGKAVLSDDWGEPVNTWSDLQAALAGGGLVRLGGDIEATDGVLSVNDPDEGSPVILDLAGYSITLIDSLSVEGCLTLVDSGSTPRYGYWDGSSYVLTNAEPVSGRFDIFPTGGAIVGGGVSGVSVSNGKFTMAGGAIAGNDADSNSGGVYVDGGAFVMADGMIVGNRAGNGGVVIGQNGLFTMSGGMISGNTEKCGVYVDGGKFTMNGGAVSGNDTTAGGVYVSAGGNFAMNGGIIRSNTTSSSGGGVNVDGGTFMMTGGTIGSNNADENGGGVYVNDGKFTMTGGAVSGNTAGENGGGVNVASGCTFTMSGGTVSGNTAGANSGDVYVGGTFTMAGGTISGSIEKCGVYVDGGTFMMEGGTISGNTEKCGVNVDGGTFTMAGGEVSGNDTTDGGVNVDGGMFTMTGGTISDNKSTVNGGGVNVAGGRFTMYGGKINSNTADENGGGVYVASGCTFTMNGGAVSGNTAGKSGGVFVSEGVMEVSGGATVTGNTLDKGGSEVISNLWLFESTITDTGSLTGEIGVATLAWDDSANVYVPTVGVFARAKGGDLTDDDVNCFISDNDDYVPILNDGQAEFVVYVAVTNVTLNKDRLEFKTKDSSETLTATVSPDGATYGNVTWSSSNSSVATVNDRGKVTAVSMGTATIMATAGGKTTACAVTFIGVTGTWVNDALRANYCVSDPADTLLIAAVYNESGKQESVKVITLPTNKASYLTGITGKISGYTYKLMLVDKNTYAPLCAAWERLD